MSEKSTFHKEKTLFFAEKGLFLMKGTFFTHSLFLDSQLIFFSSGLTNTTCHPNHQDPLLSNPMSQVLGFNLHLCLLAIYYDHTYFNNESQ